jgi:hypothetical protein
MRVKSTAIELERYGVFNAAVAESFTSLQTHVTLSSCLSAN